jgi:hypothetical protein
MSGAAGFLPKFYIICSAILILAGVAQLFVRPRRANETLLEKVVNRATITAFFSVAFGVFGLLLGLGVVQMPHFR